MSRLSCALMADGNRCCTRYTPAACTPLALSSKSGRTSTAWLSPMPSPLQAGTKTLQRHTHAYQNELLFRQHVHHQSGMDPMDWQSTRPQEDWGLTSARCGCAFTGNKGGSYITILSLGGLEFGILNIIGSFGNVWCAFCVCSCMSYPWLPTRHCM